MPDKIALQTIDAVLAAAAKRLRPKKMRCAEDQDEGWLDAEILLAHVLQKDRAWIAAHGGDRLSGMLRRRFAKLAARRERREPVAYITGVREFYGRPFRVTPATLIPRPETELFIDLLVSRFKRGNAFTLLDVGTGCGAIALTAALEFPNAAVIASDASRRALTIAKKNAQHLGVPDRVAFVRGDLLSLGVLKAMRECASARMRWFSKESVSSASRSPLPASPLVIAANPPYLPARDAKKMDRDVVDYEPHEALFVPGDGTSLIKRLLEEIAEHLPALPAMILTEFDPPQKNELVAFAERLFPTMTVSVKKDLAGRDRVIVIE